MAETTVRLKTTGMHCGSCAMMIQMSLEDLPGVVGAKVKYATGLGDVPYDSAVVDTAALVAAATPPGPPAVAAGNSALGFPSPTPPESPSLVK